MSGPRTWHELATPAALVDLSRMAANLDRLAAYAATHDLVLRPHVKTHKSPELASEQLARGAGGLTVATLREAEVMAAVAHDILIAYPPVGDLRLRRLMALPDRLRLTVALDSRDALDPLSLLAQRQGRTVGVLVEADLGMHRVGLPSSADVIDLARAVADSPGVEYRGVMFYPGHIRAHVTAQQEPLRRLDADLAELVESLGDAGLAPAVVSGGSTPTAFASHQLRALTEMRPGTYVFNDRTTAAIGACEWEDCAYTVLATVVSTAVPGQAVVDAGSKALSREEIRALDTEGFGALLDRPDVQVQALSEEHGILDLTRTDWRPRIGERVRIVPNHVCVSVNLQDRVWGVRDDGIECDWPVAARNWA